jgi:phage protein U
VTQLAGQFKNVKCRSIWVLPQQGLRINIIKGTGYQNGQFLFKSIPENVIKKLRSGDNEKMKKIIWFKNR